MPEAENPRPRGFAPPARLTEGPRIRAGEEADAGDIALTKTGIGRELAPKPKGKDLIVSKSKFGQFWIISESPGGPFIATIRTDMPANFVSRKGGRAMAGCREKSK
jgi:hypothetical protein